MAAFVVVNGPGVPRVNRGQPLNAGTIAAANNAVAFSLPSPREFVLNKIVIATAGNLSGGTFLLEGSIDGGNTFFVIPAQSSDVTATGAVDTAATFAARYDVSGLDAGCLFRFGATALTSGSGAVWIAMA
jgi:hypothetical protein